MVFCNFIPVCLDVNFFLFIPLRNFWASRIGWLMASISRRISTIIYSNMPLSPLSSRTSPKYIFNFFTLFSMTLNLSSIFFIFYYLWSAFWTTSDLFSSSLIFSLTVPNLLLNIPTIFFKSIRQLFIIICFFADNFIFHFFKCGRHSCLIIYFALSLY